MKKAISLFLCLALAVSLSACGDGAPRDAVWQETPVASQTNESLTVFCMEGQKDSDMIKLAFNLYQNLYSDVQVELIIPGSASYTLENQKELYEQVASQIMAGEGPDVFIIDDTIMDVEKLVRQGIFADMEPFFEADNFDWEPYHQAVMDGGIWNGKRFVIPLSYDFPLLFTSKTALEETGFDVNACTDYQGFLDETTRYMQDPSQTRQLFRQPLIITDVVGFSGITVADYDTQTIDLSSPLFKAGYQWYKTVMERNIYSFNDYMSDLSLSGAAAVRDGNVLWTPPLEGALSGFYNEFSAIKTVDQAVMMPIRDADGGIRAKLKFPVAVRANSENLQNAYDFIKILLSEEVQCAISREQLSVYGPANDYFFQKTSEGKMYHITAGTNGFTSTVNSNEALDWPSEDEFEEFMGYTQEITGTYYDSHLGLGSAMNPYVYENADYEETLEETRRAMEIYISE